MALTNLVTALGATHTNTNFANWAKTVTGSEGSMYDSNDGTYWNVQNIASGGGRENGHCWIQSETQWVTPIRVTSVRAKMYTKCWSGGNYQNRGIPIRNQQIIYLRIGGVWTSVFNYTSPYIGGDSQPNITTSKDETVSTGWYNCTGIKVYCWANSYAYEGSRYNDTEARIYEIEAYGLLDSKLRIYDGAGVVKIGSEVLNSSHKLRMYDGSNIIGIPLVNTTDGVATGVRINDGGLIQALPEVS